MLYISTSCKPPGTAISPHHQWLRRMKICWTSKNKRKLSHWRFGPQKPKSIKPLEIQSAPNKSPEQHTQEYKEMLCSSLKRPSGIKKFDQEWLAQGMSLSLYALCHVDEAVFQTKITDKFIYDIRHVFKKSISTMMTMRRHLCTISEEDYTTLLGEAESYWETRDHRARLRLAILFPERTDWANSVIDELPEFHLTNDYVLSDHEIARYFSVLTTGADIAHLETWYEKLNTKRYKDLDVFKVMTSMYSFPFDALTIHGDAVRDLFITLYLDHYTEEVAGALSMIPCAEVAQAFAQRFDCTYHNIYFDNIPTGSVRQFDTEKAFLIDHAEISEKYVANVLKETAENNSNHRIHKALQTIHTEQIARLNPVAEEPVTQSTEPNLDLPQILSLPPWLRNAKKKTNTKKFKPLKSLQMLDDHFTIGLDDQRIKDIQGWNENAVQATPDELFEAYRGLKPGSYEYNYLLRDYDIPSQIEFLTAHKKFISAVDPQQLYHMLPYLEGDFDLIKLYLLSPPTINDFNRTCRLLTITWPGLAKEYARWLSLKKSRPEALAWIEAQPELAAKGAIYFYATSSSKKERTNYAEMMHLVQSKDPDLFHEIVERYGEEVQDILPEMDDPSQHYPEIMPKLPAFWQPSTFTPILLKEDPSKILPIEIYDNIGLMLKFSSMEQPYIGLKTLEDIADEATLGTFVWDLFNAWHKANHPVQEEWVLKPLMWFGGAEVADTLPKMIDDLICKQAHYRVAEQILKSISSKANAYFIEALWSIYTSGRSEAKELAHKALIKINQDVREDIEPLVDRHMPAPKMIKANCITFPNGQTLKVSIDHELDLHLPASVELTDEASQLRWKRIQQQCTRQAQFISRRLEYAISTFRRWEATSWQQHIMEHPFVSLIASKLVWGVFVPPSSTTTNTDMLHTAFIVDAEGQPIDLNYEPVTIAKDAQIGLVHPLDLPKEDMDRWLDMLTDFEIIQPFDQLTRRHFVIKDDEDIKPLMEPFIKEAQVQQKSRHALMSVGPWQEFVKRRRTHGIRKIRRKLDHPSDAPHKFSARAPELVFMSYWDDRVKFNHTANLNTLNWKYADLRQLSEFFKELHDILV